MNIPLQNPPTWQCVLICWGEKYGVDIINQLACSIGRFASVQPHFLLITDRDRPGLEGFIEARNFPEYWLRPDFFRGGCQAKLAMFERGVLPYDVPTIYIDLDTIVLGDIGQLIRLLKQPDSIWLLQSSLLPFGRLANAIYWMTNRRKHARGNSSMIIFKPSESHYVADEFKRCLQSYPKLELRPMVADDRFISWLAQPLIRTIPSRFAVKFPNEYMFYWSWWLYLKALLPWVQRRRAQQVAVTFNGFQIKPQNLLALNDGDIVIDRRKRKLVWSRRTLGPFKETIIAYFKQLKH